MLERLKNIDTKIFLLINSHHSLFFDNLMHLISGQIVWLPFFAFIIFLFIKKDKKRGIFALIILIFAVGLADYSSVHLFKEVFKRFRPCHNPQLENIVHLYNGHCGGKYGFISSHAANFFSLAMFSSLYIKKKYFYILSFLIAIVVAYSRIYLGVHYPFDVTGGAIWGIIIASIFYISTKKIVHSR